jgi:hypothetical protein
MGKPSRRRAKKGRGGHAPSIGQGPDASPAGGQSPASSTAILELTDVSVSLRAKLEFHEATVGIGTCPDLPRKLDGVGDAAPGGTSAVVSGVNSEMVAQLVGMVIS